MLPHDYLAIRQLRVKIGSVVVFGSAGCYDIATSAY